MAAGRSSPYIGVFWNRVNRRWQARVTIPRTGRTRHLGCFSTDFEAALAYDLYRFKFLQKPPVNCHIETPHGLDPLNVS